MKPSILVSLCLQSHFDVIESSIMGLAMEVLEELGIPSDCPNAIMIKELSDSGYCVGMLHNTNSKGSMLKDEVVVLLQGITFIKGYRVTTEVYWDKIFKIDTKSTDFSEEEWDSIIYEGSGIDG